MGLPTQKKACEICGNIFRVWPSVAHKSKYCSRSCKGMGLSVQAHKERLIRWELIANGADLPKPRKSSKRKYLPDNMEDDPDEPTPKQQIEINKQIQILHENRRNCQNYFETAFHKKKYRK